MGYRRFEQLKCPFCALSTPIERISKKTLLDPYDIALIEIRECKGRKGLPVVETKALANHLEEYPECFEKIKDITLGLVWIMWKYNLIKIEDLPHYQSLEYEEKQKKEKQKKKKEKQKQINKEYLAYELAVEDNDTDDDIELSEEEQAIIDAEYDAYEDSDEEDLIDAEYDAYDSPEDKIYKEKEIDKEYQSYDENE
jgi:hypothetical protein